jgi:hypothetical protein
MENVVFFDWGLEFDPSTRGKLRNPMFDDVLIRYTVLVFDIQAFNLILWESFEIQFLAIF